MNERTATRMADYIQKHAIRHGVESPPCDEYVNVLGDILFRGAEDDERKKAARLQGQKFADHAADGYTEAEPWDHRPVTKPGAYERKHLTACERRECLDALPVGSECFACGAVAAAR